MKLLRLAIKSERWDLAAHTIVLEAAKQLEKGEKQMEKKESQRRGPPKGNQNARTHGFYSNALNDTEKEDIEFAAGIGDIDDEVALLRVKIKEVLGRDPENVKLLMEATNTLAGLVIKKYQINKKQQKGLKGEIGKLLRGIILPAGINLGADILAKKFC